MKFADGFGSRQLAAAGKNHGGGSARYEAFLDVRGMPARRKYVTAVKYFVEFADRFAIPDEEFWLVPERGNEAHEEAVGVWSDGYQIGYLQWGEADKYWAILTTLRANLVVDGVRNEDGFNFTVLVPRPKVLRARYSDPVPG